MLLQILVSKKNNDCAFYILQSNFRAEYYCKHRKITQNCRQVSAAMDFVYLVPCLFLPDAHPINIQIPEFKVRFFGRSRDWIFNLRSHRYFAPKRNEESEKWIFCHDNPVNTVHAEHKISAGI